MNHYLTEYSDEIQVGVLTLASVTFASMESVNDILKAIALVLTILYTAYKWINDHKKNGNDKA